MKFLILIYIRHSLFTGDWKLMAFKRSTNGFLARVADCAATLTSIVRAATIKLVSNNFSGLRGQDQIEKLVSWLYQNQTVNETRRSTAQIEDGFCEKQLESQCVWFWGFRSQILAQREHQPPRTRLSWTLALLTTVNIILSFPIQSSCLASGWGRMIFFKDFKGHLQINQG